METVKKYCLWGIFISILTVFAMSYNANAITPIIDMGNYENLNTYLVNSTCEYTDSTSSTGYSCNLPPATPSLQRFHFNQSINVKKGDLVHFYLLFYSNNTDYPSDSLIIKSLSGYQSPFRVKHFSIYNGDIFGLSPYITTICYQDNPEDCRTTLDNFGTNISRIYEVVLEASADANNVFVGLRSNTQLFYTNGYVGSDVRLGLQGGFTHYRYAGSAENREQQEKTQEAADASEDAGGDSSTDAQQGTTSLINAITGAVTVISSASPTNCRINGNMGNLDIGQLDLCANPAPAFVTTIGSLILILMCVPLAITLFNRFISLFRSFQS